jgi:hypothetical protein
LKNTRLVLDKDEVNAHVETIVDLVNMGIRKFTRAMVTPDILFTLKVLGALYLLGSISSCYSSLGFIYPFVIIAFVWPRLYQEKKTEIDQICALVTSQIMKYVELAISKLPPSARSFLKQKKQE